MSELRSTHVCSRACITRASDLRPSWQLTHSDRDGLKLGGIPADIVVEHQARDIEKLRKELDL